MANNYKLVQKRSDCEPPGAQETEYYNTNKWARYVNERGGGGRGGCGELSAVVTL